MNAAAALQAIAARWAGRERFVVLDACSDDGQRFAALRRCWRDDAERCRELVCIALAPHGWQPTRWAGEDEDGFARMLADALPPPTPGLHRIAFDGDRLQLLLSIHPPAAWPRQLLASADLLRLPWPGLGDTADERRRRIASHGRLAAPGARLEVEGLPPGHASQAIAALAGTGFEPAAHGASHAGARLVAEYRPRFVPPVPPGRRFGPAPGIERHALVIGAGLAGSASACALAERGWRSTLIDRHATPASEASGHSSGVFHGVFHPGDGLHARFNRAAALEAARAVRLAIGRHGVAGAVDGLLRIEGRLDHGSMQRRLAASGLPPPYLQALDAAAASARCGLRLERPCWFYPEGGWVDPRGLVRSYLARAGEAVEFIGGREVAALVRSGTRDEPRWTAFDRHGAPIACAPSVVLANAGDVLRLMQWPVGLPPACQAVRGQLSSLPLGAGVPQCRMPITGNGYLLPPHVGRVVFGATAQPGQIDLALRPEDDAANLRQLERLAGAPLEATPQDCGGRAAVRWVAADRLPLIGAAAAGEPVGARSGQLLDRPARVPRQAGLHVFAALGSRGIGWSALGGQIVASWVCGAPAPVEADLIDAVDPARLAVRAARRA